MTGDKSSADVRHPGGDPMKLRLTALEQDVLYHFIEDYHQETDEAYSLVLDSILDNCGRPTDAYGLDLRENGWAWVSKQCNRWTKHGHDRLYFAEDGSEVDIRDDGSIQYETPRGAVQEIEPTEQTDLVDYYEPYSVYPADEIQVHRLDRYQQSEPADFGGGDSTGVQSL